MTSIKVDTLARHQGKSSPQNYHLPVMVEEVLFYLVDKPGGVFVDATIGGAGHSSAILQKVDQNSIVVGIDVDNDALTAAQALSAQDPRLRLFRGRFSRIAEIVKGAGLSAVDGVLADLGVSSHQLDTPQRGFSFMNDGPLDLRLDQTVGAPASTLIAKKDERELAEIMFRFGEERGARRIAREIVDERKKSPIETTARLARVVEKVVPLKHRMKSLARVFQAFRLVVNNELAELEEFLPAAFALLVPGARLVVLSYHSLEDRIVKQYFARKAQICICPPQAPMCTCGRDPEGKILTKKVVVASDSETSTNPRARSAKLRAIAKLESGRS